MVCVLSSYAMSNWINRESFFEMLSRLAGLEDKKQRKGNLRVKDVLKINQEFSRIEGEYLWLNGCTVHDISNLIRKRESDVQESNTRAKKGLKIKSLLKYIPIVDNKTDKNLLFMV